MLKTCFSKDFWLVQLLSAAALAAVLYFNIAPGTVNESLGLTTPVVETQVAQVVSGATITVANDQELFNALIAIKGGETIALKPGVYSEVNLDPGFWKLRVGSLIKKDYSNNLSSLTSPVVITSADSNNRATMTRLNIVNGTKNIRIENVSFRPREGGGTAVTLNGDSLALVRCDISYGDSSNWTAADWNAKTGNGIDATGTNVEIAYNYLKNVNFAIQVGTANVHHNVISGFIGDGLRGWDNSIFEHNVVSNPYEVNDNHIDGFQSWTLTDVPVKSVTLRNNTFIAMPSLTPLRSGMQGIGLFDGPYKDWVIEHNLVVVDHYHGIAMYGGVDSVMRQNVVIDPTYEGTPGPSWVMSSEDKGGTPPSNVSVSENYANTISMYGTTAISNNVKIAGSEYDNYFPGWKSGDWMNSGKIPFAYGAVIDPAKLAPEPYAADSAGGTTGGGTTTPAPTVSLTATPTSLAIGSSATLTWSSTDATSCSASGAWGGTKSTTGSESVAPTTAGTYMYMLSCSGVGGNVSKSVSVSVVTAPVSTSFKVGDWVSMKNNVNVRSSAGRLATNLIGVNPGGSVGQLLDGPITIVDATYGAITWFKVDFMSGVDGWVGADNYQLTAEPVTNPGTPAAPTLNLSISPTSLAIGSSATLTWSSTDATSCSASGAWGGPKATTGSASTGVMDTAGTYTYTLACTGAGGTATKSVSLVVLQSSTGTSTPTWSSVLKAGDIVMTIKTVNVREISTTSSLGKVLGQQPTGVKGVVGNFTPTVGKNYIRVYVDFETGIDGWVVDAYLKKI